MSLDADDSKLPELKQQAIEWLILLRTPDMSEADTEAFADWLSADIRHADAFAKAETLFNDMAIAALSPRVAAPAQHITGKPNPLDTIAKKQQKLPSPAPFPRWLALPLALAAAWLFAVMLVLPKQANFLADYLSDYHTDTGEQRIIQLADGSQILMNTNTAVSVNYRASSRQITLHHGQAQFTVAKDVLRPFEVKSDKLTTRALGTVFEVYLQESGFIDITVLEHAVAVTSQDESFIRPIEVREHQQLRYQHGRPTQTEAVDTEQTGAWRQHRLFINDRPLQELIEELDRYRYGRIFLTDKLKDVRVSGMFSLADPDAALVKVRKILALQETRMGPWWVSMLLT